jgi:phosphoribosylaminoimidazole-succinocarboxamide synthase
MQLTTIKEGKIRTLSRLDDPTEVGLNVPAAILIKAGDGVSAFDQRLGITIPDKGVLLTQMSAFWFEHTKDIIPNHMIRADGNQMYAKPLMMLPVECIVRGYITGSGWESYQKTGSVCGIALPSGLQEAQKLDEPIFTPTTKEDVGVHDRPLTFEELVSVVGTDALAEEIRDVSIKLYKFAAQYALERGIIIADMKMEFGIDENGNLVLADEFGTPDCCRFWPVSEYQVGSTPPSLDKQPLRNWLKGHKNADGTYPAIPQEVINDTRARYIKAYESLTGKSFTA